MKLIIRAKENLASENICKIFLQKYPELAKNVFEIPENVLDLDKYEAYFERVKPELIIVASSHKSSAGVNTLTVHSPGNWTSNDLGGEKEKLSISPALYLREALLGLKKEQEKRQIKYEVSLEVTHHSPTVDFPVIFVEVGSSEKQWKDKEACEAVADTIAKLIKNEPENVLVYAGFGGNHYAPTFSRRILESRVALGHICPKYQLDKVSDRLVLKGVEMTSPKPVAAVIERKGTSKEQRDRLIQLFETNKINWKFDKGIK